MIAVGILAASLSLSSCKKEKFFDKNINNDPTALTSAEPSVLLPAAQANLAYYYAGDLSRYSAVFTQQFTGSSNQFASYEIYNMNNSDFGNCWNAMYKTTLNNFDKMITSARARGDAYYEGIGKIMMAYSISMMSDLWGDIPFSEALKGSENLSPNYDKGSDIYTASHKLLDEGIALMGTDPLKAGVLPAIEDLVYGGDAAKWIMFAHAVKARLYIHVVEIDPAAADKALAEIAVSFKASGDQATIVPQSPSTNPMYQFQENRNGDITYIGSNLLTMMYNDTDARVAAFVDTTADAIGPVFGGASAPVYLLSYTELKFMEAELLARKGDNGAGTAYANAVNASFDQAGVTGASNILAKYPYDGTKTNVSDRIKPIMMQKYVAMFGCPEAFSDYRRTGFPGLTPKAGSSIPHRFLYPDSEANSNKNMPQNLTLFTKIWWEK